MTTEDYSAEYALCGPNVQAQRNNHPAGDMDKIVAIIDDGSEDDGKAVTLEEVQLHDLRDGDRLALTMHNDRVWAFSSPVIIDELGTIFTDGTVDGCFLDPVFTHSIFRVAS